MFENTVDRIRSKFRKNCFINGAKSSRKCQSVFFQGLQYRTTFFATVEICLKKRMNSGFEKKGVASTAAAAAVADNKDSQEMLPDASGAIMTAQTEIEV